MIEFLKRLFSLTADTTYRKRAGFRHLDVDVEADKMRLEHHGGRDGAREVPATDATRAGTVEAEVMELGKNLLQENVQHYEQEYQSYSARLAALTPQGMLSDASLQTQSLLSSIAELPQRHAAHLAYLRDKVAKAQKELKLFRHDNGLEERDANYPDSKIFQIGFMVILLVGESFLNAVFLAEGNQFGLLGGWTEAVMISLINGLFLGAILYWAVRWCICYKKLANFFGVATVLLVVTGAICFNLLVAHYRNALGGEFPEQAGAIALRTFVEAPWALGDFKSVMLLLFGLLVFGLAAVDWSLMDDIYPGYGRITRKNIAAHGELAGFHHWLVQEKLQGLRDETDDIISKHLTLAAQAAHEDLRVLDRMKTLNYRMMESIDNIESGINRLLHVYREENRSGRETDPPGHFHNDWKYNREINFHALPAAREMPPIGEFTSVLEPLQQELTKTYRRSLRTLNEMNG